MKITYAIYQCDIEAANCFRPCPTNKKVNLGDYDVVYSGEIEADGKIDALDKLFVMFNCERPKDFKGRSMSVSDLVRMNDYLFYCDSFGWTEVQHDSYHAYRAYKDKLTSAEGLLWFASNKREQNRALKMMALKTYEDVVEYCRRHCTATSDRSVSNWQRWCDMANARLEFLAEEGA